jgi:ParB family chromosome partitioning protein
MSSKAKTKFNSKMALGKGIASLLSSTPNEILYNELNSEKSIGSERISNDGQLLVAIENIRPNPNQPRKIFKDNELEELARSIKENGIIQPLIVTESDEGYELIAGERRLKASSLAGLEKVPVVIKRATDKEKMAMAIIENIQRSDLNCVEIALAYFQLMEDFKMTQEEVAKRLGRERSSVANYLRVLKLPRAVIALLQTEKISFGHAKVLASEKESSRAISLAKLAVQENLSVRELEKALKNKKTNSPKISKSAEYAKIDGLRQELEKHTGFHFDLKSNNKGAGKIVIKFNNASEFNDIFEYITQK